MKPILKVDQELRVIDDDVLHPKKAETPRLLHRGILIHQVLVWVHNCKDLLFVSQDEWANAFGLEPKVLTSVAILETVVLLRQQPRFQPLAKPAKELLVANLLEEGELLLNVSLGFIFEWTE